MTPIKLVFFGSPEFAATILEHLVLEKDLYQVVGVVTNPDKITGRKQVLTPSPVAVTAQKYHLPVFKPEKLDAANLAHLKLLKADIFLVAAYGKIIPPDWLAAPKKAILNLHYSLLPKYRGALCVSEAIRNCDSATGVTLMEMDEKLDHGPIISQAEVTISDEDDVTSLTEKLTATGLRLLDQTFPDYLAGKVKPQAQDETQASYTPSYKLRSRQSAFIPWLELEDAMSGNNAPALSCLIRSLNPDPGVWSKLVHEGKEIEFKLLEVTVSENNLRLDKVQLPGKLPITWDQFASGYL